MFYTICALFSLVSLIAVKATNPDVITDCTYDCLIDYDTCESKSGECRNFIKYFSNATRSSSYATSSDLEAAIVSYCLHYNTTTLMNYSICDNATVTLAKCMVGASCWMSTTEYSVACPYYATAVANFTATSSSQSIKTLCASNWAQFFDNLLGGTYVTVSASLDAAQCGHHRRALLAEKGEISSESFSESESKTGESSNTLHFQITIYFYSEAAYNVFYTLLVNEDLITTFTNDDFIGETAISITCLTTTCCDKTSGSCTTEYDNVLCNATATTTTPAPTPATFSSDAMSNKPFIFVFVLVCTALCTYLF